MSVSPRVVITLMALLALGAVAAVLIPRSRTQPDPAGRSNTTTDATPGTGTADIDTTLPPDVGPPDTSAPTSETLIADALKAREITYEQSLLQRAYAIFDDPRLDKNFRSPLVNWEAASTLFLEVQAKEQTLSKNLLAALAPFRVRPSDPISIFNRSRAEVVTAQLSLHGDWEGQVVSGTNVRLWNKGAFPRRADYEGMVRRVWRVLDHFFPVPLLDNGTAATTINPDGAIDIYLVDGQAIDPRTEECQRASAQTDDDCTLRTDRGITFPVAASQGGWTGYVVVNRRLPDADVIDTVAHELAHATQMRFDRAETMWLRESTATWVGYKVMKFLGLEPTWEYGWLKYRRKPRDPGEFFSHLFMNLDNTNGRYGSWIFFYYASMELGDDIVTKVWEAAAETPGADGIQAVKDVIPIDDHFKQFVLRNWNQETVPKKYETKDNTYKRDIIPLWVQERKIERPSTVPIGEGVFALAASYYRFTFVDAIRTVTYQSLALNLPQGTPRPHVWAVKKINSDWKDPEDWTEDQQRVFCRDTPDEAVTELILIVSNSDLTKPLPRQPKLRVLSEDVGCPYIDGWAKATLRAKDDRNDMTYRTSRVNLRFKPRSVQDVVGNVQYDLMPTSVIWTASGRQDDCTVSGEMVVNIPARLDQPIDTTLPAFGYMNVIGIDGGDFHHIMVVAADLNGRMKRVCPGPPPQVYYEGMPVGHVLQIVYNKNTHVGNAVVFKGPQKVDMADPFANLPEAARNFNLTPPTVMVPGVPTLPNLQNFPGFDFGRAMSQLKQALRDTPAGRPVYTFEYELKPLAGAP